MDPFGTEMQLYTANACVREARSIGEAGPYRCEYLLMAFMHITIAVHLDNERKDFRYGLTIVDYKNAIRESIVRIMKGEDLDEVVRSLVEVPILEDA